MVYVKYGFFFSGKYPRQKLFHCDTLNYVGECNPYLVVYIEIISHKFSPSPYFTHKYDRKSIYKRINELKSEGLGYKRIHKVLVSEKFKIGKSPTTVDSMIKKMDRRDRILNQKVVVEIVKVDIEFIKSG